MFGLTRVPALYIKNQGEESLKVALSLTRAPQSVVVRITGGCGYMSAEDAANLMELYAGAFFGFRGALLFGGSRMLKRTDPSIIVPGITEVGPRIKLACPDSYVLGIIPRSCDFGYSPYGLVVADNPEDEYFTVVHPDQDAVLLVQQSVDQGVCWEAEYLEAMEITRILRQYAGWRSLLVSYNGGGVTEKEVLATAQAGWPVLLIRGSGRKTDSLAEQLERDFQFRLEHPSIRVCDRSVDSFRAALQDLGVVPREEAAILQFRANRKGVVAS